MDKYMYYNPEDNSLFGTNEESYLFTLASINDIKQEMWQQRKELQKGIHPDGYLIPWEGILVCKEGKFTWDKTEEDYIQV